MTTSNKPPDMTDALIERMLAAEAGSPPIDLVPDVMSAVATVSQRRSWAQPRWPSAPMGRVLVLATVALLLTVALAGALIGGGFIRLPAIVVGPVETTEGPTSTEWPTSTPATDPTATPTQPAPTVTPARDLAVGFDELPFFHEPGGMDSDGCCQYQFFDDTTGWYAANEQSRDPSSEPFPEALLLWRTTDGGRSWRPVPGPRGSDGGFMTLIDANSVAIDYRLTVVVTRDAGATWQLSTREAVDEMVGRRTFEPVAPVGAAEGIRYSYSATPVELLIAAADPEGDGDGVPFDNRLWISTDRGFWRERSFPVDDTMSRNSAKYIDALRREIDGTITLVVSFVNRPPGSGGQAFGGQAFYASRDDGQTWQQAGDFEFRMGNPGWQCWQYGHIHLLSESEWIMADSWRNVCATTDAGANWVIHQPDVLVYQWRPSVVSTSHVFMAKACYGSADPCGDLTPDFGDENRPPDPPVVGQELWETTDGGATWHEVESR